MFLAVESGDLLFPDMPLVPDEVPQRRVKAEMILEANRLMGLDAAGVGDQDLRLGVEYLKEAAARTKIPFLSANLVDKEGKPVFPTRKVVPGCDETKIGLFSVMTPLDEAGQPLLGDNPHYKIEDPIEAARREVGLLQAEGADVVFALTHLGLEDDMRLAREVPGIAFIFGGHSMSHLAEPQRVAVDADGGKRTTWIFQSGYRGKHLGRVDVDLAGPVVKAFGELSDTSSTARVQARIRTYQERIGEIEARLPSETDEDRKIMLGDQLAFYKEQLAIESKNAPKEGSASKLSNRLVELSREVPDHPRVAQIVEAGLQKIADLPPVESSFGEATGEPGKGPEAGPFVGAQVCQACHQAQYADWKTTGHAKAWKTLVDENHASDFDCVSCHTTGYRQEGGPKDPFTVAGFEAVQCESCHGAGRAHALEPKKVDMKVAFDEASCRGCHSVEQTGERFVFGEYLPKVDHGKSAKKTEKAEKPAKDGAAASK